MNEVIRKVIIRLEFLTSRYNIDKSLGISKLHSIEDILIVFAKATFHSRFYNTRWLIG